jgi:hypothetical protein
MISSAQPKYTEVNLPFRRGHRSLLMSEQSKRSPDWTPAKSGIRR